MGRFQNPKEIKYQFKENIKPQRNCKQNSEGFAKTFGDKRKKTKGEGKQKNNVPQFLNGLKAIDE